MYVFTSNTKRNPALVRSITRVAKNGTSEICINIINRNGRWMARERFMTDTGPMGEYKDGTPTPTFDVTDIIDDATAIAARLGNPLGFDPARALWAK